MNETLKYIIFLFVLMAGFFAIGYMMSPKVDSDTVKTLESIEGKLARTEAELRDRIITGRESDTVWNERIVYHPYLVVRDTGRIVFSDLTVNREVDSTLKFTSAVDSVLNGDTVSASYAYPENMFELRIRFKADSSKVPFVYEKIFETKIVARPLWLDILSHTGSAVLGFAIGYAAGK